MPIMTPSLPFILMPYVGISDTPSMIFPAGAPNHPDSAANHRTGPRASSAAYQSA